MPDCAETRSTRRASGGNYATSVSADGEPFGYAPNGSMAGWSSTLRAKEESRAPGILRSATTTT